MTNTNNILDELRKLLFETINHSAMQRMRIAELFDQLDKSLSNGGRLPDAWSDAIRPQLRAPTQNHYCITCDCAHVLPLCKPDRNENLEAI